MATAKLDETALRRPDFRDGTPVVLADGQTWVLPSPVIRPARLGLRFHRPEGGGRTRAVQAFDAGGDDEYGALLDRLVEAEYLAEEYAALADLAFHLLSLNYELSWADARALLVRRDADGPGREASDRAWQAIADVALGRQKKA